MKTTKSFFELMRDLPNKWMLEEMKDKFKGKEVTLYENLSGRVIGKAKILDDLTLEIEFAEEGFIGVKELAFVGRIVGNETGGYDVVVDGFRVTPIFAEVEETKRPEREEDIQEELLDLAGKVIAKYSGDKSREAVKSVADIMARFCKELMENFKIEKRGG